MDYFVWLIVLSFFAYRIISSPTQTEKVIGLIRRIQKQWRESSEPKKPQEEKKETDELETCKK